MAKKDLHLLSKANIPDEELELSARQRQILHFIREYYYDRGFAPTVREIADACGLSSGATVYVHLQKLQQAGFVGRTESKPRALGLLKEPTWRHKEIVPVPLVGRITAGAPILAEENIEDTYPLPLDFVGASEDVFMLTVSGDSMINAGIHDGDLIIVRKQNYATNGEIVVALIDDETATVKRYYRTLKGITLQPENDAYEPIVGKDNIQVIGKVIALFRTF